MTDRFPSLHIVKHPLISDKLSQLRDKNCPSVSFRAFLREITLLMAFEALHDLPTELRDIETPVSPMKAPLLGGQAPSVIPILRAGLGMSEPLMELIPTASVGHIGVYRDHDTKKPVEYLVKLPSNHGQPYILVDPMLATGNSLVHACDVLNQNGVPDSQIRVVALVIAPEGIACFAQKHPTVTVYGAALDSHLNENAYIVPGLGDAGDRFFGTVG